MINETNQVLDQPNGLPHQHDTQSIETAIAKINIRPNVEETSNFLTILNEIPKRVNEANTLLEDYRKNPEAFVENIDEATLDKQIKDMAHVSTFLKEIETSRGAIKTYMNGVRDQLLFTLDKRLEEASFNELSRAQSDIKQLKSDVEADRRSKRWGEIQPTFEANVNRYPLLAEFAAELTDFSKFKLLFPKLISGAKTRKVKESDHTMVNETLYSWNTAVELMKENAWGLAPQDLNKLLTLFKQNPSVELVQREGRQLRINADEREKARQAEELRRKEQERQHALAEQRRQEELARVQEQERQAELKRDVEAKQRAEQQRRELEQRIAIAAQQEREIQMKYAAFGGQYKTVFKESFPQFIAYLFNNPNYHDVHSNANTKASVIYDIMHQVDNQNSIVARETRLEPQKVCDLVRYILDA